MLLLLLQLWLESSPGRTLRMQGFDRAGRPVMLCNLAAHLPGQDKKERKNALIWCMEHLVTLSERDFQTSGGRTIIIFDLQGYTMANVDTEDAATLVDILQVCTRFLHYALEEASIQ
jgi:hypothetical protein